MRRNGSAGIAALLCGMLLGASPASSWAQATLGLSVPELAEAVQCARTLAAAKDGPYRIELEGAGGPEWRRRGR